MSDPFHTKVALLSDTHGMVDHRVADVIDGSDWVIHAGDIGNATILHQLAQLGEQVVAVRGNNDTPAKWPEQDHEILAALPIERRLRLPGGEMLVLHGHRLTPASQRHQRMRNRYSDVRAVVYGHSHRLCEDTSAEPWILNPGAAGRSRTYGGPSCLLLWINGTQWHVETHRFHARGGVRTLVR